MKTSRKRLSKPSKTPRQAAQETQVWRMSSLERIERLIEAVERSQGQVAQLLEHLQRHTALPGVKTEQEREFTDRYNTLLAQLAGKLETINHETQADAYIDRAGRAGRRSIDKARHPARAGTPPYLYARHQFFENISDDVRHAGMYFPARRIHLPNLRE